MKFTLFKSDKVGVKSNCVYPTKVEVSDADTMADAVAFDHVCATYKKHYRSNDNFIQSDVVPMDIDNDHSEDPKEWITEKTLEDLFGGIDYVLVPSRHHLLQKDGKTARPRYHVYFPIGNCTDTDTYNAIKVAIHKAYPFFDMKALDAARFLFGSDADGIIWHEGWMSIEEEIVVEVEEEDEDSDGSVHGPILE